MNFFQFAQSSKSQALNPFSSVGPTLNIPSIPSDVSKDQTSGNSSLPVIPDTQPKSTFHFNSKKVTFPQIPSNTIDIENPATIDLNQTLIPEKLVEDINAENIDKYIDLLDKGFKSLSTWAQTQIDVIQKLQEQIDTTQNETNQFLHNLTSNKI